MPVVIADIGEYLREISELRGVEAVVILPIMPRAEEAPANSRHCWGPDFEEARLAVNHCVTDPVGAMPRVMTWRHVGGLNSTRFLRHCSVHMDQRGTAVYIKSVRRAALHNIDFKVNVICLQECWLSDETDSISIQLPGYDMHALPREELLVPVEDW